MSQLNFQDSLASTNGFAGAPYVSRQSSTPSRTQSAPFISTLTSPPKNTAPIPKKNSANSIKNNNYTPTSVVISNGALYRGGAVTRSPDFHAIVPTSPPQQVYKHSIVGTGESCRSSSKPSGQRYVALHDYTARVEDDLSMSKGQQFYIVDRSQGYWWYAKCTQTGRTGYVPFNYLAPATSLESNEYVFYAP